MLSWFNETMKKSKAAVILQNLFSSLPVPWILPVTQAKLANAMIEDVWSELETAIGAEATRLSNPIAIAAIALAHGLEQRSNIVYQKIYKGSLGYLIIDIQNNLHRYSFNGNDLKMLDNAQRAFEQTE